MSGRESRETEVLAKCDYFANVGSWPAKTVVRPREWLSNFDPADRSLAVELLDAFVYYNAWQMKSIFRFALHSLSNVVQSESKNWQEFWSQMIVTHPTGETPNPTDSGPMFTRYARQEAAIPETQIMSPQEAIKELARQPRPLVFVDDFVGTGSQLSHT